MHLDSRLESLHTHLDFFKPAYAFGYSSSASIGVQMAPRFAYVDRGASTIEVHIATSTIEVQRCGYIPRFGDIHVCEKYRIYIDEWASCVSSLRKGACGAYVSRISKGDLN